MKRITLFVILFALTAFALAQAELPDPVLDFEAWAGSAAALAAAVLVVVAFAKKHFNLHGIATLATSFGLAVAASVGLHYLGHIDTIATAVIHGLSAGLLASGGWDALKGLIGGGNAPLAEASDTRTDASRARLQR